MKSLITTIQNIFKIEELRNRIITTLLLLLIYRLGSFVVLPGIDPNKLAALEEQGADGLLGLFNMFAGGAFSRASIFALGIMPYISASIVVQLLTLAVPTFQKMQKEGEDGRRKMNQITRYLTILITGVQAVGYLVNLRSETPDAVLSIADPNNFSYTAFMITSVAVLIAGTMFTMWLGERITEKGLGNGISLIIMVGIIARLPVSFFGELQSRFSSGGGGLVIFLLEIVALLFVIMACILLVQGTRRIPIQYAKRIVGNRQYGGVRQYLPMKVNAAGVMPIIFAQALMFVPSYVAQFFPESATWQGIGGAFINNLSPVYNIVFGLLILIFTYFYTAITVNPRQIADQLKQNGGFIPGIKPGSKTEEFIDNVMSRITLPGAIFLALVAIMPAFAGMFNINSQFAQFFGGTSLLIMVGVMLDTLQQIESHLLMRKYDGLAKNVRIKGRSSGAMAMQGMPQ